MKPDQQGFTLIELAIVMLVLTILAAGVLVPMTANIEMRRYEETKKLLEQAREALIGYAINHSTTIPGTCKCTYDEDLTTLFSALPSSCKSLCPVIKPPSASFVSTCQCKYNHDPNNSLDTIASSCVVESVVEICPAAKQPSSPDSYDIGALSPISASVTRPYLPCPDADNSSIPGFNDGLEDRNADGSCKESQGNLPWATLGIASVDAWGNRLFYDVHVGTSATDPNSFTSPAVGIHNTSVASNTICASSTSCSGVNLLANQIPFVVVSWGPNGKGALSANGSLIAWDAASASTDEIQNHNKNGTYVSRPPSQMGSTLGEFDDLVIWVSTPSLLARICPAGGCP
jgi:prepilin-type N-terminal cleavage/methylation domain-containing protein